MPKAIFLDIDGTLLSFATRQVPKSAFDVMYKAKENGIKLFIATGRHKKELGIDTFFCSFPFDGYVTQNGAYCYTNDTVVHTSPVQKLTIQAIIKLIEEDPFACIFCEENEMFINYIDDIVTGILGMFKLPIH